MISYMRLIVNPKDDMAFARVINEPKRGIGPTSMNNARQIAAGLGVSLFEVISQAQDYPAISRAAVKFKAFAELITKFEQLAQSLSPAELLERVLQDSGYIASLQAEPDTAEDRLANLDELKGNLLHFRQDNPESTLTDFLEEVALLSDIDTYNAEADTVVLMTLHSAKGLEFPVVYIPGMDDGIFPGMQSLYDPAEIEEERRLAYVGITRAREKLVLVHAARRMLHGATAYNPPSRFLAEIPESLKECIDNTAGSGFYGGYARSFERGGDGFGSAARSQTASRREKPAYSREERKSVGFAGATLFSSGAKKTAAPAADFHVGDAVRHKKFGSGVIMKTERMGNDTLLEVAFAEAGTKKLMANSARLDSR